MTQRRNIDTDGPRRFEDRDTLLKLTVVPVDYRPGQSPVFRFSPRMRDRRTPQHRPRNDTGCLIQILLPH